MSLRTDKSKPSRELQFFDDEQERKIRNILSKYPDERVNHFIEEADGCPFRLARLKSSYEKQTPRTVLTGQKARMEGRLTVAKQMLTFLESLAGGRDRVALAGDFKEAADESEATSIWDMTDHVATNRAVAGSARQAVEPFRVFVGQLEGALALLKAELKPGRPANLSFVLCGWIAEAFLTYIGEPTGYLDGAFSEICEMMLKAVGEKTKDPDHSRQNKKAIEGPDHSRQIKKAIKELYRKNIVPWCLMCDEDFPKFHLQEIKGDMKIYALDKQSEPLSSQYRKP